MRIWSSNKASFVDFADGYSYLPFIPSNFGIKEQELLPEDLAVLFHEFSHQLSLKGPFGWLCAYFQSDQDLLLVIFQTSKLTSNFRKFAFSFSENLEKEKYYMELLGVETFYEIYGDCIANYVDLIECYRWVLEGIALLVQLDYKSSIKFDAASDLFYFAAELVKTEKYRGKKQMGLVDINEYINKARDSKFTSGLLQYILENT